MVLKNWVFSRLGILFMVLVSHSLYSCWSLNDEGLALLRIRESVLSDPFGALKNWRSIDDHCSWFGVECSDGKVVILNLKDLCLEGTLAPELRSLIHIKSINLRNNSFNGIVPEGFGELKELGVLDLGYNNFSGPLPRDLGINLSLAILLLDNNELLGGFSPEIYELQILSESQVDENRLSNAARRKPSCNKGSITRRLLQEPVRPPPPPPQPPPPPPQPPPPSPAPPPPSPAPPAPPPPASVAPSEPRNHTPSTPNVPKSPPPFSVPSPAEPPNFVFVPPSNYTEDRRKAIGLVAGLITGASALILLGLVFVWFFLRWKRKQKETTYPLFDVLVGNEFENGTGPREFSYRELASATNNFCEEAKLGKGGFGEVYKGFLKDLNTFVAVKRVSKRSKQGSKEYTAEVKIISQLRHRNTVKLIGWCHEKDLILVYEFMPNGSLDSHLFKGKSLLTWDVRNKIVQGLASALLYLHEEGDHCVLHRDIKSSNIMLDSEFNAKLGDFGLARFVDHAKGSQTTALAGTIGYMAPECLTASKASKESDVFSFGIVVLEIACGRRSIEHRCDESQVSLVPWVWESYGNKRLVDVVDKKLGTNFDIKKMECLMIVGLWCAHPARNQRPSIRQAIRGLNFELPLPNLPSKMPVPNYDVPSSSTPAPAPTAMSCDSSLSLIVPR